MANYKLGVDSTNAVKIYTGDTAPTGYTNVGIITGIKVENTTDGTAYDLPSGITATATGDSTKTVKVTLGSGANSQTDESLTITVSGTDNNTITLESNVTREHTGYSVTPGTGKIDIKKTFSAGWKLSGTSSATYAAAGDGDDNVVTVSGLKNAAITSDDYTFDTSKDSNKIITLKASALEGVTSNVDASNSNDFTLAIDDSLVAKTAADTDFTWTATAVAATQSAPASTTMTLTKELNAGWTKNDAANTTTLTYRAASSITYATIYGLAADAKAANMPEVAKNAQVVDANNPYNLVLTSAVLPTKDGAEVTLTDGASQTIDTSTNQKPNFSISTSGFETAAKTIPDTYEAKVDGTTATFKQMIYEYWAPENASGDNAKLTHHTQQASNTALVSVENVKADSKIALDGDNDAATADIIVDPSTVKTVTLKASALDGNTVTLTNASGATELYKLEVEGVSEPGATHDAPGVSVSGSNALVTVQAAAGYTLGEAPSGSTKTQTLTYSAAATVTLATIAGVASGASAADFAFSADKQTITLNKKVLADAADDNATVTVTENTIATAGDEGYNPYESEYDFKLAIHEDVTEYGEGEKTPTLVVNAKSTEEGTDETGDMTARIQVTESAGWKLGENATVVAMTAASAVDVVKLTGLGEDASTDADGDASNGYDYVTFDKAKGVISVSQSALTTLNASLITVENDYSGYKVAFDGEVDAPGTKVVDKTASITVDRGAATITGTLNEGWTLDSTSAIITYKAAQEKQTLAQISGLSDGSLTLAFGDDDTDTPIDESKIVYLSFNALMDGHVALANKTINTTVDGATLGTYTGDFALGLLDSNSATVDSLGYAHTYDWVFTNDDSTAASYNEGTEKGWSLSNAGLSVIFDAEITPDSASATKLMTVTGLKGGESAAVGTATIDGTEVRAIGYSDAAEDSFVAGLWIGTAYSAAAGDDPEVLGIVNVNRTVLDDSADGKVLSISVTAADFGKYGLSLDEDTASGASAFVPTKANVKKYIWEVSNGNAAYKEATAEYWSLGSGSTSVTYHAQTSGTVLAKITGIAEGLSAVQGDDFEAHSTASDDPYVITGSYIYDTTAASDPPTSSDAVISLTTDYKPAAGQDEEATIGVITLGESALDSQNVTFVTGSASYSLALDGVTTLGLSEPSWSVSGTTATYQQLVETAGYEVTGESAGNSIIYMGNDDVRTLAIISGLKSGIEVDTPEDVTDEVVGISVAGAFSTGIVVDESGEYPVFTINGNILDSTTVTLKDEIKAGYSLAIGAGALDSNTSDEDLKARITDGVDVWRFTKTSKGVITAATYENVIPSHYKVADDGLSITNTPEKAGRGKTYVTLKNFKFQDGGEDKIVIQTTALDASEFSSEIGYINDQDEFVKGLSVAEDDSNVITVLENEMLDPDKDATLTDGSKKYTFALGESVSAVGIDDNTASWSVENGTAILTADLTKGWAVDIDNSKGKAINHYNELEGKVIATITGLSAGTDTIYADLPTLDGGEIDMNGSFSLSADNFDGTDVNLTNGINSDGKAFTFGIALDADTKTKTDAARTGVARWYLKDATTLDYSTIHDAHYEDHGISSAIAATTIKFVDEAVGANIASITNLKAGATLNVNVDNTVGKYFKDTSGDTANGTPVDGITVSGNSITVTSAVLNKDATKPLTLTNGTGGTFKFVPDADTVKVPSKTTTYFKVDGTKAELWQGLEEGFKATTTKITYMAPKDKKTLATISGIKSGLVAGTSGDHPAVGTKNETTGDFDKAVITSEDGQVFVLGASALDTVNVSLTGGTDYSIKLDNAVQKAWWDTTTNSGASEAYSWKVSGTTATFNKGNKEGWSNGTGASAGKLIEYHKEGYDTVLSTVTNLASGLKVDPENYLQVLDKDDNTAITLYNDDDKEIRLYAPALTTKDVLLQVAKTTGDTPEALSTKANKLVLFQEKETVEGVSKGKPGYVAGKSIAGAWDASIVSGNKATYSVTTTPGHDKLDSGLEGAALSAALTVSGKLYDDRIIYTKAAKVTSTITGLNNDTATSTITLADVGDDDNDPTTGQFTIPKAALADSSNVKLTNGKGNDFTIALSGVITAAAAPVWNFKNGTATYTESYIEGNYMPKTEGIEYTYVTEALAKKPTTLFTITGFDKTKVTDAEGLTAAEVKTKYGIELEENTTVVAAVMDTEDTSKVVTPAVIANVVKLDPSKGKLFANTNVVIKKGTQEYEFDRRQKDALNAVYGVVNYYENNLQWSYNKGTATLDAGKSAGWAYKVNKDSSFDYTTYAYSKAAPNIVATVKGLNTNLELGTDNEGNSQIYVKTETQSNGTLAAPAANPTPVLSYKLPQKDGDDNVTVAGEIVLTNDALPTTLKNNIKITLTTPRNGDAYVLNNTTNNINTPVRGDNQWSIDTKGVASYQYTTDDGWTLDTSEKGASKILTYSTAKDTVLAKISGLTKDPDLSLGISTYVKDEEKSTATKTVYKAAAKNVSEIGFISVESVKSGDNTNFTFTFEKTGTDANNVNINKALTTTNVTLTQVDKNNDKNTYKIVASDALKPETYSEKWTVVGKSGKATYTAGTNAGYTNTTTGNKAGTLITYNKEKVDKTLATITGLKKDTDSTDPNKTLEKLFADDSGVIEVSGTQINVKKADELLVPVNDKPSTVTLTSKEGYTFGTLSGTANTVGTVTTQLTAKGGTVNLVKRASGGNYTLSADNMKIVYNKTQADTILATVKGLNKDLTVNDSNKVVVGSGTTEVVKFADDTITLSADALANGKVTFTLGKGVEEGDYTLKLDPSQVNQTNGILTKSGNWRNITEWTINKGTATYKTYDKGYYYDDGKGGFAYSKESKGTTHATITGLKTDLTTIDTDVFQTSGKIKLTSDQLITSVTKNGTTTPSGKNVTLKNQSGYNFTLAFDTETANKKVTESTLDVSTLAWNNGKQLTATQTIGYQQASDTSITYIAKDKPNQLIATVTGLKKTATLAKPTSLTSDFEIKISSDDIDNKNITLTTTALAKANYTLALDGVAGPSIVGGANAWATNNGTATYTGYVATAGYTTAASGKSITYTEKNGTEARPKALTTIKGVGTATPTGDTSPVVSKGNITMGNGLLPVSYDGTGSVTGSKDNDSITVTAAGVTVTPGKGDDFVTLSKTNNGVDTIIYANNDGHDVIANFASNDKIKINGVNITKDNITTSGTGDNAKTIITVGKGSIELRDYNYTTEGLSITDKSGTEKTYGGAADLLIDDNYSMDAAALSDIVEPFKASYTPYDFDAGLDLVKQNSLAPAVTFTGEDKK